ncbi:putative Fimh-like protein [Moraxella macacae 0408225]|uniref:Putative Fimh-like protein n=1 Tax=Moraxella macacae 0408225 TaxID=1230338 RepID=L2F948_9GAMM|nr:DUF1566 domain-containing protein [Moraxella macacae]ELA09564.1 putative Fimh-like protein [Moraxella macacae 0408225]
MNKILKIYSGALILAITATTSYAAQTCSSNISATTPSSRFELLNGGNEVKDKQTGLIWQRCSVGQTWDGKSCTGEAKKYTWQQALKATKEIGNHYRLPNIKELKTILEHQCQTPAINTSIFDNTASSYYWSSSPRANRHKNAWSVDFDKGHDNGNNIKTNSYPVRAVRSQ